MIISQKTIEKLRELINEETEYRSGSKLVAFFNQYGFRDVYGNGFPSGWDLLKILPRTELKRIR